MKTVQKEVERKGCRIFFLNYRLSDLYSIGTKAHVILSGRNNELSINNNLNNSIIT